MEAAPTTSGWPVGPLGLLAAVGLVALGGWVLRDDGAPDAGRPMVPQEAPASSPMPRVAAPVAEPERPAPLRGRALAQPADRQDLAEPERPGEPAAPAAPAAVPTDVPAPLPSPTEVVAAAPPTDAPSATRRAEPEPPAIPSPTDVPVVLPATPTPRWTPEPTPAPSETIGATATPDSDAPPAP